MQRPAPLALLFDVFGTVVDWRSGIATEVARAFEANGVGADPTGFADAWRAQYQPAMQRIRTGARGYVSLDLLHRENLDIVLEEFALSERFDAAQRDALNHAWEKLPPWPDAVAGLAALRRSHIVATCSNGSIALMARLTKFAGLSWDAILGAEIANDYKPSPRVYLRSCEALGVAPRQAMMVAAHNDDLRAARKCGLMTAFVRRPLERGPNQTVDLEPDSDWDIVADDFMELSERRDLSITDS